MKYGLLLLMTLFGLQSFGQVSSGGKDAPAGTLSRIKILSSSNLVSGLEMAHDVASLEYSVLTVMHDDYRQKYLAVYSDDLEQILDYSGSQTIEDILSAVSTTQFEDQDPEIPGLQVIEYFGLFSDYSIPIFVGDSTRFSLEGLLDFAHITTGIEPLDTVIYVSHPMMETH